MGSATSTINIRGSESSSTINIRGSESSSSSSPWSFSPEQLMDGAIKAVVCVIGCDGKLDAMNASCGKQDGSDEKKLACFKAAAALRKCMHDNAAVYESIVSDEDQQQQGKSSQA